MAKHIAKPNRIASMTAKVRETSRDLACGKGVPGRLNPNRTVKFDTPSDKKAARGRTFKGDSHEY